MENFEEVIDDRDRELDTSLDEDDSNFVNALIDKLMVITNEVAGIELHEYQRPFARRIFESLILNDGATITALFSRQSGKTETVADVIATAMIMFPRLARIYPLWLGKYRNGVWVGAFAPVDEQADNLFGRIEARLRSDSTTAILADPQIDDRIIGKGRTISLKNCGSLVRKTTCHPRATIEGRTYHVILVDECQGADERVINKSVSPMGAAKNATKIFTGTPSYSKGVFYDTIRENKRAQANRGKKSDHFEVDWRTVGKNNPDYKKAVEHEMRRLGRTAMSSSCLTGSCGFSKKACSQPLRG